MRTIKRQGFVGFALSTADSIVDAWRRERAYVKGTPQTATLYLTYRCTSRCRTCTMWSRQWDIDRELSLKEWMKAADILVDAGVRIVEIFGGDVLLRKDTLIPLIKHLKSRNITVHIPTNCNLLDREMAKSLVESCVDFLYLSTDGVGDTQNAVRGIQDSFGRVRDAVKELSGARNGLVVPRLICNTTVSKYNVDSLHHIARFAMQAGFDEVHFEYVGEVLSEDVPASAIDGIEPTPYYLRGEESVLVRPDQVRPLRENLKSIRKEFLAGPLSIATVNIDAISDRNMVEGIIPMDKCYIERCEVTVDPAGNVIACPFFHSFKFGNLIQAAFADIWYGERHKRFHKHLKTRGLPMCRRCILSVQRNHSFRARLKRILSSRGNRIRAKAVRLRSGKR